MPQLLLKRHKDYQQGEGYLVYVDNRYVGRIFNADAGAPKDRPWFWGLELHEWQGTMVRNTATLLIWNPPNARSGKLGSATAAQNDVSQTSAIGGKADIAWARRHVG
jgi:hypothetical protein